MRMGHGGITCVLQTQFSSFFIFLGGGGEEGEAFNHESLSKIQNFVFPSIARCFQSASVNT